VTPVGGVILFLVLVGLPILVGVVIGCGLNPFEAYSDGKKYHRKLREKQYSYGWGTSAKDLYEDYSKKSAFMQDIFALGIEAQKRKDVRDKTNAAKRSERFQKLIDNNE